MAGAPQGSHQRRAPRRLLDPLTADCLMCDWLMCACLMWAIFARQSVARCRANMAYTGQSRPDVGLGSQTEAVALLDAS